MTGFSVTLQLQSFPAPAAEEVSGYSRQTKLHFINLIQKNSNGRSQRSVLSLDIVRSSRTQERPRKGCYFVYCSLWNLLDSVFMNPPERARLEEGPAHVPAQLALVHLEAPGAGL